MTWVALTDAVDDSEKADQLPTDRPILVVCASGALSSQVATVLGVLGYNVRNLSGGMAVVPVR